MSSNFRQRFGDRISKTTSNGTIQRIAPSPLARAGATSTSRGGGKQGAQPERSTSYETSGRAYGNAAAPDSAYSSEAAHNSTRSAYNQLGYQTNSQHPQTSSSFLPFNPNENTEKFYNGSNEATRFEYGKHHSTPEGMSQQDYQNGMDTFQRDAEMLFSKANHQSDQNTPPEYGYTLGAFNPAHSKPVGTHTKPRNDTVMQFPNPMEQPPGVLLPSSEDQYARHNNSQVSPQAQQYQSQQRDFRQSSDSNLQYPVQPPQYHSRNEVYSQFNRTQPNHTYANEHTSYKIPGTTQSGTDPGKARKPADNFTTNPYSDVVAGGTNDGKLGVDDLMRMVNDPSLSWVAPGSEAQGQQFSTEFNRVPNPAHSRGSHHHNSAQSHHEQNQLNSQPNPAGYSGDQYMTQRYSEQQFPSAATNHQQYSYSYSTEHQHTKLPYQGQYAGNDKSRQIPTAQNANTTQYSVPSAGQTYKNVQQGHTRQHNGAKTSQVHRPMHAIRKENPKDDKLRTGRYHKTSKKQQHKRSKYLAKRGEVAVKRSQPDAWTETKIAEKDLPQNVNERRVQSEEDQLYFSRKPRPVKEFQPKSTAKYLQMKPKEYYELGKLPADLFTDELIAKRNKVERVKAYAERQRTANAAMGTSIATRKVSSAKLPAKSSRERALEFAKSVPRPRGTSKSATSHGRREQEILTATRALPRGSTATAHTMDTKSNGILLDELELKHELARHDIEALRREFQL